MPDHVFWAILDAGLQITPKLSVAADFITLNTWHYPPSSNVSVHVAGGLAPVAAARNDNQFTQSTWFILSADYALLDELDLGLGYYNLANAVAPDGQARSVFGADTVWWSPDARLFFSITLNLDVLFDDVRALRRNGSAAAGSQIGGVNPRDARSSQFASHSQ